MPIAFISYYIASLAECKRAPFDLPEAESELVSGFHTEYSGMRFAIFFLAEYAAMYVVSALASVMFLGGWYTGIAPLDRAVAESGLWANALGALVIITKSFALIFVQMWLRWTLPRIRLDQMMTLCLKVMVPIGMFTLVIAALWQALVPEGAALDAAGHPAHPVVGSVTGMLVFVFLIVGGSMWVRSTIRATTSFKTANYRA
jgi:NADH-quinone oxidoreductase subunit H